MPAPWTPTTPSADPQSQHQAVLRPGKASGGPWRLDRGVHVGDGHASAPAAPRALQPRTHLETHFAVYTSSSGSHPARAHGRGSRGEELSAGGKSKGSSRRLRCLPFGSCVRSAPKLRGAQAWGAQRERRPARVTAWHCLDHPGLAPNSALRPLPFAKQMDNFNCFFGAHHAPPALGSRGPKGLGCVLRAPWQAPCSTLLCCTLVGVGILVGRIPPWPAPARPVQGGICHSSPGGGRGKEPIPGSARSILN